MQIIKWIPVEERLPLEEYRGERVIGEFLVTVEINDEDPNCDREIMIMYFCSYKMCFMLNYETAETVPLPYEDHNTSWHIIAWAEKPGPYGD